jgi:2-polyprenyl-3-methyl-5-hydroxy-6-metoxy-1,4-benzoquinol methylase
MSSYGKETVAHGITRVTPLPSQQELSDYYAKTYYQKSDGKTSTYDVTYTPSEIAYKKLEAQLALQALRDHLPSTITTPTAVDLGCGEGFFVKEFIDSGIPTKGVDFSSYGVEKWNSDVLDNCHFGDVYQYLDQISERKKTFDICVMKNVLEHVLNPAALIGKIADIITPDGLAVVSVPNDYSDLQKMALEKGYLDREFWFAPPDHLTYFNTTNIAPFMADAGFRVVDMFTSFPVDFFLFHPGSNYIADSSKGKAVHNARIDIDLLMARQGIDKLLQLYRAMAACGAGRNMTVIIKRA